MRVLRFTHIAFLTIALLLTSCAPARQVDVIAHRGNSGEAPENTLVAFKQALDLGADVIEVDVHRSRDGTLWAIHDATVEGSTNGTGAIAEMTDAHIAVLDAGSIFSPEYKGEPVPKVVDILRLARGRSRVFLDLKAPDLGPQIIASLNASQFDPNDLWLWVGHSGKYARTLHGLIPKAKIFWGGDEPGYKTDPEYFARLKALGVFGFDVPYDAGNLTANFIIAAHEAGMYVSTFTINDPADMRRVIDLGVDGIETDFPARLQAILQE